MNSVQIQETPEGKYESRIHISGNMDEIVGKIMQTLESANVIGKPSQFSRFMRGFGSEFKPYGVFTSPGLYLQYEKNCTAVDVHCITTTQDIPYTLSRI